MIVYCWFGRVGKWGLRFVADLWAESDCAGKQA